MPNPSSLNSADSQTLLNQIVIEFMREKKRKQRWRAVMRIFFLLLILFILYQLFSASYKEKSIQASPHIGLIDLNGALSDSEGSSSNNLAKSLDSAYKHVNLKAIILRINSPGGTPVQADYMYNTLQYYRKKYPEIKIYAVCVDICASAAYYVAAGADEIYANPSSMVGSIGVLYNGFGFIDTLQKLGITRRLFTAGANKGFLDPFSPVSPKQQQLLQVMLDEIHQQFIDRVKQGRGDRLKINDDTFSGLFWTGIEAKEQGLIDGFASSGELARNVIKIDNIVDYTYKPNLFEQMSKNIGMAAASQLPAALGLEQGIKS